jgi:hypothetical protein
MGAGCRLPCCGRACSGGRGSAAQPGRRVTLGHAQGWVLRPQATCCAPTEQKIFIYTALYFVLVCLQQSLPTFQIFSNPDPATVIFDKTTFVKFTISNNLKKNLDETHSKQPKIHRKIHTSLWILKISRKKSANQKSRNFFQMISKKKTIP